jgi:hypothetical protein
MKENHIALGIGPRQDCVVLAPVDAQGKYFFPAAFSFTRLQHLGPMEIDTMFGDILLRLLATRHRGACPGLPQPPAQQADYPLGPDTGEVAGPTERATLLPAQLAVGIDDDGGAIQIETRNSVRAQVTEVLRFDDLAGDYRNAATLLGTLMLVLLGTMHPALKTALGLHGR